MNSGAPLRAAMRRITEALTAFAPATEIHQIVAEEACRLTDASSAALCLLTAERDMLDFVAAAGENADAIAGLRIRVADSLSEAVIKSGEPALADRRTAAEMGDLFATMEEGDAAQGRAASLELPAGARSAAVVPVFRDGRVAGTLSALNKQDGGAGLSHTPAFHPTDIETLRLLADMATLGRKVDTTARSEREHRRELTALYHAARTISSSLNVQEVMDSVLDSLCLHLEYHSAALFLLNDDRTHLFIAAERGLSDEEREIQLTVDSGMAAKVVQNGHAMLIRDSELDADFEPISERANALAAMYAPVRSREETYGLMLVTSLQRNAYDEDDLKLAMAVGMQAGIAIENAWLYEDAQRQAAEATALYELSVQVNETLNVERVLEFVAENASNLLKADKFVMFLWDEQEERLIPRVHRGMNAEALEGMRPRVGEGIGGWVFEWQTPQAVADVTADRRNASSPLDVAGVASTLCVPMHVGEDVIGVVHAMSAKRRLFTVAEMELLYTIANQAAAAVANATLFERTRAKEQEMRVYFKRVGNAIGKALDSENLPQILADIAVELVRGDRCAVYRLENEMLRLSATSRFRASAPPDLETPLGAGLAGWVARRGQSLLIEDLREDPRALAHTWIARESAVSYLGTPIKLGRQTVGVAEIYSLEPRAFTKEEANLLASFARRTRVAEKLL